jgi:hypothetical protein
MELCRQRLDEDRMKAGEIPPDQGAPRPSCPGSAIPRTEIAAAER